MIFNVENIEKVAGIKILPCKDCGKLPDIIQTRESEFSFPKILIGCNGYKEALYNKTPLCRCMILDSQWQYFSYDEKGIKYAVKWWNRQQLDNK